MPHQVVPAPLADKRFDLVHPAQKWPKTRNKWSLMLKMKEGGNSLNEKPPFCAPRGNRTPTVLLPQDFESSASTNSAIRANGDCKFTLKSGIRQIIARQCR